MTFLKRLDRFNRAIATVFQWVGIAALMVIVLIAVLDVFGSKIFTFRVPASTEVVGFAQITAIGFALSVTQLGGMMIRVDFFVDRFPPSVKGITRAIVALLVIGLFAVIIWRMFLLAQSYQATNQVSSSAKIPLYIFAYGLSFACLPVISIMLHELLTALAEVRRK